MDIYMQKLCFRKCDEKESMRYHEILQQRCEQMGLNAALSVAYFSSDSLSSVTQALEHNWVTNNHSAAVSHLDTRLCFSFPKQESS